MSLISERAKVIKPSATLAFNRKAAELKSQGRKIISLAVGEPDFETPENIKNAAIDAINKGYTKYTNADGIPELKKAVQNKFQRDNNLSYNLDELIICVGGKGVLYNMFLSTINDGDEVIMTSPYWVSYTEMVSLFGGKNVIIKTKSEDSFKLTPDQLISKITPKTKWLLLNSPSNPTGAVYTKEELEKLAEVLIKNPHVNIVTDDIYEHIVFEGLKFYNIANISEELKKRTFIVNGVAKGYGMTGWRIGYGAGSAEIIKTMVVMQSQSVTCATSISQYAAIEALNGDQGFVPKNTQEFEKKRDLAISIISQTLDCFKPMGAFYLFPSIKKFFGKKIGDVEIQNSIDFCTHLLDQTGVACIPGYSFGDDDYFRISYATSYDNIREACSLINGFCNKIA